MLLYEHERTEKIVERLRDAEHIVRLITIMSSVALFALTGISMMAANGFAAYLMVGGIIGVLIGVGIGHYSMILLSAVIDWMCQMLIAQGEVIEETKRKRKA